MMAVPLTIFIVFGVLSGGGLEQILRKLERTLWLAIDWVAALVS